MSQEYQEMNIICEDVTIITIKQPFMQASLS